MGSLSKQQVTITAMKELGELRSSMSETKEETSVMIESSQTTKYTTHLYSYFADDLLLG